MIISIKGGIRSIRSKPFKRFLYYFLDMLRFTIQSNLGTSKIKTKFCSNDHFIAKGASASLTSFIRIWAVQFRCIKERHSFLV